MIFRCGNLPCISPWLHQDKGFITSTVDGIWVEPFCSLPILIFYMRLFKVLAVMQYTKAMLPSPAEFEHCKEINLQNFPDLNGVWCMVVDAWLAQVLLLPTILQY